ncbi:MAG: adenylate kinase family protein [Candidatus Nanoarchaeia archaeon]
MKLVFLGVQGSGKGTQAKILSEKLKIPHISTGDLLRNAKGELKQEIDSYINKGALVPDELMLKILKQRLEEDDCKNGFILDGFPRNIKQAEELSKITNIQNAFNIEISDEEAIKRLSGRRNCKNCGAIYNINTNPIPKKEGICDKCSSTLYQRADDNEEAIKKRLAIYHQDTKPIIKFYNTVKVNGEQDIAKVSEDIAKAIKFLTFFK